jgi:hypothetical protein
MAKMFARTKIILPDDVVVPKGAVFEATPQQARQFDHLNAARVATVAEIKAAEDAQAKADGLA